MKTLLLTIIFNVISISIAAVVLKLAIDCIIEDIQRYSSSGKKRNNPFEDINQKKNVINQLGLSRFASIGAFVLPFLILSIVYLMLIESFYELALNYLEGKGLAANIGSSILAIVAFFVGASFARKFLRSDSRADDLGDTENIIVIESRLKKSEIAYFSVTFFIILFNYLDLDLRFNMIKAITTSFVAGNIYYVVFRLHSRIPRSLGSSFSKKKDSE